MKNLRILFTIALAITLPLCALTVQAETWTLVGDLGGAYDVDSLLVTSEYLYAGTAPNGDVFRSSNGSYWTATGNILSAKNVKGLAQDSAGTIYAGVGWNDELGVIWKSTNHGSSWTEIIGWGTSNDIMAVQDLLFTSSGKLYAGTAMEAPSSILYATTLASNDGGTSWEVSPKCAYGWTFALLEASDGSIYAGGRCYSGAYPVVYRLPAGSADWTNAVVIANSASVLALTEGADGAIYAGIDEDGGVYKSIDNGDTWTLTGGVGGYGDIQALVTVPDGTIYAGKKSSIVIKTENGGVTWENAGALSGASALNCLAVSGNYIYAGTSSAGKIYRAAHCDCIIDGDCYNDYTYNPANSCQYCDSSLSTSAWSNWPDGRVCNDGEYCTVDDECHSGQCTSDDRDCDDGADCTADSCDEDADTCVNVPDDALCIDEFWCNGIEFCDPEAGCTSGTPPCTPGVETCNELLHQCQTGIPDISVVPAEINTNCEPRQVCWDGFEISNDAEVGGPDLVYTIDPGPPQVTDIVGGDSGSGYLWTEMTVLNMYGVDEDTTLRSVSMFLNAPDEYEVTAVVYEFDGSGNFALIDEKTDTVQRDYNDFYTVNGLRTPLVGGKAYYIGFTWQDGASFHWDTESNGVSFGTLYTGYMSNYYKPSVISDSGWPSYEGIAYQKITTGSALPWVSVEPLEGSISPSQNLSHDLEISTYYNPEYGEVRQGTYTMDLLVESNDPDEPSVKIPMEITVGCQDCYIWGACWDDHELSPADLCEICDPVQSDTSWSPNDACIMVPISIRQGFNLLGRTMKLNNLDTASAIAADIDAQGGSVLEIQWWDDETGSWLTFDPSFPLDDFPVGITTGFFVRAAAPSTWEITGLMDAGRQYISVVNGYTMIAVPTDDYALASDLFSALSSRCDVSELIRWDANTQGWETFNPMFPIFDYSLDRTSGYFLRGEENYTFRVGP